MNSSRPFIAALLLLTWLWVGAHLALEHGGEIFGSHLEEAGHGHHDDEGPADGDGDHHHDLGVATATPLTKTLAKQLLAPQRVPIYERLVAELAARLRGMEARHEHSVVGDSPPDTRRSGWLLVVQTALPVRGPSLAA